MTHVPAVVEHELEPVLVPTLRLLMRTLSSSFSTEVQCRSSLWLSLRSCGWPRSLP